MSTTQTTPPADQVTTAGRDRTGTKSPTDSVDADPDEGVASRPLPAVSPDQEDAAVTEQEHAGPVIPSEMDVGDVPLLGSSHDAASPAMPGVESGQLHRLMATLMRHVEIRDGELIDHELVERWAAEGRHPKDMARGARDHELGALALATAVAEHLGDDEDDAEERAEPVETREHRSVETRSAGETEQAALAAFNGGDEA